MSCILLISALLFLVNHPPLVRSQTHCPSQCQCNGSRVSCTLVNQNQLSGLPFLRKLPLNTTTLEMTCNASSCRPEKDMFADLPLTALIVRRCFHQPLVHGVFNGLDLLVNMTLEGNNITLLGPGVFNTTPNLVNLELVGNGIGKIEVETFDGLRDLQDLKLDRNNLSFVNVYAFTGVQENVSLSNNPLACNCHLEPLWERFRHTHPNMICPEGNELSGSTWDQLNSTILRQICPSKNESVFDWITLCPTNEGSATSLIILAIASSSFLILFVALAAFAYQKQNAKWIQLTEILSFELPQEHQPRIQGKAVRIGDTIIPSDWFPKEALSNFRESRGSTEASPAKGCSEEEDDIASVSMSPHEKESAVCVVSVRRPGAESLEDEDDTDDFTEKGKASDDVYRCVKWPLD